MRQVVARDGTFQFSRATGLLSLEQRRLRGWAGVYKMRGIDMIVIQDLSRSQRCPGPEGIDLR